jgi:putative Mg2+ transporter-C (MgtC) family protein
MLPLLGIDPFLDIGDTSHLWRDLVRLLVAAVLGGLLGVERQQEGKAAGMRTHMIVSVGAALFALLPLETAGDQLTGEQLAQLSRVMQGIVTGIGFLGAGTILKLSDQHEIKGLTTAASIWLAAGIGMGVGIGWLWPSLFGTLLGLLILFLMHHVEHWVKRIFPPRSPRE